VSTEGSAPSASEGLDTGRGGDPHGTPPKAGHGTPDAPGVGPEVAPGQLVADPCPALALAGNARATARPPVGQPGRYVAVSDLGVGVRVLVVVCLVLLEVVPAGFRVGVAAQRVGGPVVGRPPRTGQQRQVVPARLAPR
jgi:hypothetical protein